MDLPSIAAPSVFDVSTVLIARCPEHGLHGERAECFVCGGPVEQVPMLPADYFNRDEIDWLQSAARRAADDTMVPSAAEPLRELARKLARLRESAPVPTT